MKEIQGQNKSLLFFPSHFGAFYQFISKLKTTFELESALNYINDDSVNDILPPG